MIKKYVGTAKVDPDSFTPLRLITMMRITMATAISTRYLYRPSKADTIWATPAETDTATVRM